MPRWSFTKVLIVTVSALALVGCPDFLPQPGPVANFSASPRTGNTGMVVSFTDLSTVVAGGTITSWQWDFGDGSRSTAPNPTHTYLMSGAFDVKLTVTSSGGSNTRLREDYIQVSSPAGSLQIGQEGGTASSNGVSISAAAGALTEVVNFGITRITEEIDFNVFETINRVGDTFRISHDYSGTVFAGSSDEAPLQPLEIAIPYDEDAVPTGSRIPAKVHILAQLEDGLVVPILGQIHGGTVSASVTELPVSARYTVVYRPEAYLVTLDTESTAKSPTTSTWNDTWTVSLSPELLRQLTALRLGTVNRADSFGNRNFTEDQLEATVDALESGIAAFQGDLESLRARSPRLVSQDGAHSIIFYNLVNTYPTAIGSIDNVVYAGSQFGTVVVDPGQLLAISTWNADRLEANPENVDIAFALSANQAITEVVTRAVIQGYDYPVRAAESPSDEASVDFAAGITEGLALFLGQIYGGMDASRAQLDGDFALLSTPVFAPFDASVPGYRAASQEFFRYVHNRFAGDEVEPLAYIAQGTGPVKGMLEEIRLAVDGVNNLTFEAASRLAATAADNALFAYLDVTAGEAYLAYALDLAFEHGQDGALRPSDLGRLPLVLDESRFAGGALASGVIAGADGGLDFPMAGNPSLTGIPPLTTRAVKISVNPDAAVLTLGFNRNEWTVDARNQGIYAVVYREGLPGVALAANETMLEFTNFEADAGLTTADFYVLIVNTSVSTSSSVEISATSSSTAP